MGKIGDNAFVLKFREVFINPSSKGWNKLLVETVERTPVFMVGAGHRRGHVHSSL